MIHYVRENETGYQDFSLIDNDVAYNGTGATVALVLLDKGQGVVDMTGKVAWLVAASGTVRVSPAVGDLQARLSPYSAVFIVTLNGLTYSFPKGHPSGTKADQWVVWR